MKNACNILVRKPEGKSPLGRPRRRWKDNIRMDLREVRWRKDVGWVYLVQYRAQWRDLNTVLNLHVP
jgi:hypothetical protein